MVFSVKDGGIVDSFSGVQDNDKIKEFLAKLIEA